MITTNDSSKYTFSITEINGIDIDWEKMVEQQLFTE